MKTSSISLRVADFLKGYPPFNFIPEEDLLRLAGSGRVKFHESDELVFEQGKSRSEHFFVIQQGTVNLYREQGGDNELTDVRVEGNMIGLLWESRQENYLSTARTASDTILYALPVKLFVEIAKEYPPVQSFLRAYYSPNPSAADSTEGHLQAPSDWLKQTEPVRERSNRTLLTAGPTKTIRQIAKQMAPGNQEAVIIVDENRLPLGVITESDMCGRVASGEVSVDAPASELMTIPVVTIPPGLSAGELIIHMLNRRVHHLVITADGQPTSPVLGVVGERDLALLHGRLPTMLTNEIRVAKDAAALSAARERADELLLLYLDTEAPTSWIADFITEIDSALTERAIKIARDKLAAMGRHGPGMPFCWIAFHSEGRRERLLRSAQRSGIVFADPETGNGEAAAYYYVELAREVTHILDVCGFSKEGRDMRADNPRWCRPISEWKAHYSEWISHPIENDILRQTPFFDLRGCCGEISLVEELYDHIKDEVKKHPTFIPLLANDALANLPPVTIFRDSVIDKSGILWTCIDTKAHILYPLVDIGRVLALEYGFADTASSMERYRLLCDALPEYTVLFKEAIDSVNFGLYLQTTHGLRARDDGQFIRPADLGLIERERIKTVFRTVAQLIDFAAIHFKLRDEVIESAQAK